MHPPMHTALAEQVPSGAVQEQESLLEGGEAVRVKVIIRVRIKAIERAMALDFFIESVGSLGEVWEGQLVLC